MNKSIFIFSILLAIFNHTGLLSAVQIGSVAPAFTLISSEGKEISLNDFKGKIVVLEWFNPSCPFVEKHYRNKDMQALQEKYSAKDVVWLTINSTNPNHSNYLTPEKTKELVSKEEIRSTAVLLDPDGKVGKAYEAKSTPHMYIINQQGNLVYQGAIDDSPNPQSDPKGAKNYVALALDEILEGKQPSLAETKQYGCSIKYAK